MEKNNHPNYLGIVSHYENCLDKYGDTHRGVDWPNPEDAMTRYRVMLDLIPASQTTKRINLLDFGCGASHLYDYILANHLNYIKYTGLDLSEKFIRIAKEKHPDVQYYCVDILKNRVRLPNFDYVVLNGVFTEKRELSHDEMWEYFKRMISRIFEFTRIGLAFNVMSFHVDWERDDLFHLSMDKLAAFLVKDISRDFVIRNDYRLYEYTTYVYRR